MNKNIKNLKVTNEYLDLGEEFYSYSNISSLNNSKLLSYNKDILKLLNIDEQSLCKNSLNDIINGKHILKNSTPYSMVYAGHQFGYFVPQLGDGRAINLGTINNKYHLQLKGSGLTKYSRMGDGKAVLRSSIREYLCSEAMRGLGIPTTNALGIITSKDEVYREEIEMASIVLRVSPSWVRFGTFEYFSAKNDIKNLKKLANYTIKENYPHLLNEKDPYEKLFFEVVDKTAYMISLWMAYGFMHGVMNTDNMSIAGLTIDYGPYAFMDNFDINNICNHTDTQGRYSYINQPYVAKWNLEALANAFSKIANIDKLLEYNDTFLHIQDHLYIKKMEEKLGINYPKNKTSNQKIIKNLLSTLNSCYIDYTLFFNLLSQFKYDEILNLCIQKEPMIKWLDEYKTILQNQNITKETISQNMQKLNPKYVLKNYILQEAIQKAKKGDYTLVNDLLKIVKNPFKTYEGFDRYMQTTPIQYSNIKLSCSS